MRLDYLKELCDYTFPPIYAGLKSSIGTKLQIYTDNNSTEGTVGLFYWCCLLITIHDNISDGVDATSKDSKGGEVVLRLR